MRKPISPARRDPEDRGARSVPSSGTDQGRLPASEYVQGIHAVATGALREKASRSNGKRTVPDVISILIADDHPLFRDGLRKLLNSEPGYRVVGQASDGHEVVELAIRLRPDVILLDVSMPGRDGLDALRELSALENPARILLVTGSIGDGEIVTALKLGACGVLFKGTSRTRVIESIRSVMAGQYWIAREAVSDLVRALRAVSPSEPLQRPRDFGLTKRESEVVAMVVAGCSNPDIAERCRISEQTVKHHIGHIFDKLGVSNRLELALFAVNHKLSPPPAGE